MRLLVDLGNSRLKWALSDSGVWQVSAALHAGRDVDGLLDESWDALSAPRLVVLASVAAPETRAAVERWVERRWRLPVHAVKAQPQQLGVINRYREPTVLGADRWAALIGARAELPQTAAIVVDCGTAVTIDALSAAGEFQGGVIFPGLQLLRGALVRGTAALRVTDGDESSCFARSTADAIAAGSLIGLAGAIERVCDEMARSLGEPTTLITGGDAARVAPLLQRAVTQRPDLVLRGLDRIALSL